MADPTLKKTSIKFGYTASDGYRMSFEAKGGTGTQNLVTAAEVPPEKALLAGLAELSRILTLFGMEVEAQKVFGEARQAVHEWRASRGVLAVGPTDGMGVTKLPPMGTASQSACGCYSYESGGIKTEHKCEAHRTAGVKVWTEADQAAWMALPEEERRRRNAIEAARGVLGPDHQTFSRDTPMDPKC